MATRTRDQDIIAATVNNQTSKTALVDADAFFLVDSGAGNSPKKTLFGSVKSAIRAADVDLTNGEGTMSRRAITATGVASGNGTMRLTYFTARKTETITQVRIPTGATAAVGATLCRVGIFTVDGSGNITLVASTTNDTALWIAASTSYTKSLSSSFSKVAGTLYAVGILVVGTSTAPTFLGSTALNAAEAAVAPRLGASVSGQTDLPSSVSAGSIGDSAHLAYVALVP